MDRERRNNHVDLIESYKALRQTAVDNRSIQAADGDRYLVHRCVVRIRRRSSWKRWGGRSQARAVEQYLLADLGGREGSYQRVVGVQRGHNDLVDVSLVEMDRESSRGCGRKLYRLRRAGLPIYRDHQRSGSSRGTLQRKLRVDLVRKRIE